MQYRVIQNGWNDKNFIIPLFCKYEIKIGQAIIGA